MCTDALFCAPAGFIFSYKTIISMGWNFTSSGRALPEPIYRGCVSSFCSDGE